MKEERLLAQDLDRYGVHVRNGDWLALKRAAEAEPAGGPMSRIVAERMGTIFPATVLADPAVPLGCLDIVSGRARRRFRFDGTEIPLPPLILAEPA